MLNPHEKQKKQICNAHAKTNKIQSMIGVIMAYIAQLIHKIQHETGKNNKDMQHIIAAYAIVQNIHIAAKHATINTPIIRVPPIAQANPPAKTIVIMPTPAHNIINIQPCKAASAHAIIEKIRDIPTHTAKITIRTGT